ncbi:CRISPR-associated protein Csx19 [Parafrankia sp. EUN1f]|uniref:type III-D CRISPR-associated protein Csx19 n=1 Tax=Parafrankia sp. EUN1f TaxID=102897 RepID=UPI0001C4640B|nr:CRISPR-associated protein Csx19 [Parafrankia sp. EUN1f]EFC81117.1 hypothetical protein FrEUN1fDRAFT_5778 [Parafrankia sp. EUN1f]
MTIVTETAAVGTDRPDADHRSGAPRPRPTWLFSSTSQGVTLIEAIDAAEFHTGTALLASAQAYHVARLVEGRPRVLRPATDGGGAEKDLPLPATGRSAVFEARLFDGMRELRWLHDRDGLGTAVLLGEDEVCGAGLAKSLPALEAIDTIGTRYLLWGRPVTGTATPAGTAGEPGTDGWLVLADARIGLMPVPMGGLEPPDAARAGAGWAREEHVYLHTVEYVATDDTAHVNAAVVEERLSHLALRPRRQVASPRAEQRGTGER